MRDEDEPLTSRVLTLQFIQKSNSFKELFSVQSLILAALLYSFHHYLTGNALFPCEITKDKQTCYLHNLYCCPHVAIVFRSDFVGWGESTIKLLIKIHQYLCNPTRYECLVYFSRNFNSPSSK